MLDAIRLSEEQLANLDAAIAEGEERQRAAANSILRCLADDTPSGFDDINRRVILHGEIERDLRELKRIRCGGFLIVPGGAVPAETE